MVLGLRQLDKQLGARKIDGWVSLATDSLVNRSIGVQRIAFCCIYAALRNPSGSGRNTRMVGTKLLAEFLGAWIAPGSVEPRAHA